MKESDDALSLDLEEPMQVDGFDVQGDDECLAQLASVLEQSVASGGPSGHPVKANGESSELQPTSRKYEPLKPRNYQSELASEAINGANTIICAPTGSGKTLTAALVYEERKKRKVDSEPFKALFVVCLRSLVTQQKDSLSKYLPNVGSLGEGQYLEDFLKKYDIVVVTAQIVVNALRNNDVKLEKLGLIVFDECHHANLEHPYNQLMKFYHKKNMDGCKQLPQILGLTASLGVGDATSISGARDHYIKICANLDCHHISHVRQQDNKEELEFHNPKPSPNQIMEIEKRTKDKEFYKHLTKLMQQIEDEFLSEAVETAERGRQQYEGKLSKLKLEAEGKKERRDEAVACEALLLINSAWIIHEELRAKDSLALLDQYFRDSLKMKSGIVEKTLYEWYERTRKPIQNIVDQEKIDDWPMLNQLCSLIRRLFNECLEGQKPKGIIMAEKIQCVDGLLGVLKENIPGTLIAPGKFVGHRRNVDSSMTPKEQEKIIEKFRDGDTNLLVATGVAQEGLDIPTCNFVIRYDFVSNEIGSVQSQGRARARDSQCFLIAYKDSINVEREIKNMSRERWMQEALDTINDPGKAAELKGLIERHQEAIYEELKASQNIMDTARTAYIESNKFSLHCRRCKAFLCSAGSLLKYGSHYICDDEEIATRLAIEPLDGPDKDFREDSLIGKSVCGECREGIGSVLKYKRGSRTKGYSMGKKSIQWREEGTDRYEAIKKWENVPFVIHEKMRA